jgi:DNA-binding IscR family transcriptional regulator
MKLTSQEEYGLRCLLRVGARGDGASLTIPELARAEGISEPTSRR